MQARWAATKKVATFDGTNIDNPQDVKKDRRSKVVLRRLKPSCKSDWNTDPTALPYFFYQLRERTKGKFPLYLDNEHLSPLGATAVEPVFEGIGSSTR